MFESSAHAWYQISFCVLGGVTFLSWLCFARLSMARIEREMSRDGLPRSSAWDGVGLRALWYVYAIALPVGRWNRTDDPMIDVPTVRRYATPFDRLLGTILFISGNGWVILIVVGGMWLDLGWA